jgi:ABC-type nitrate/sulfonate/bicarbonate transport system substrate-binding protein
MRLVRASARIPGRRITLALASVALLVTGCHVPGSSASGAGATGSQTITVAVVSGAGKTPLSLADAPLRVAVRNGIFRQHGLNVVIKSYQTLGGVMSALGNGTAQVASGDYTSFLYQQELYQQATGGMSLRLIADGYDAAPNMMEILTLPGSAITSPQKLQGATVATPERVVTYSSKSSPSATAALPYNIETLAAATVLRADGVSPSAVRWKPTPVASMISELQHHQVGAILAPEPYVFEAESQLGAQELLDSCSGATTGLPLSGYFSLDRFSNTHSAAMDAFRSALLQAQADAAMRGPVQAVLPSATGMTTQDAALVTLGTYPTSLSVGQVQRVAQLMFDSGMIGNALNVKRMVTG